MLVGVDYLFDETTVRLDALAEQLATKLEIPRGNGEVGSNGEGLSRDGMPAGATPVEERERKGEIGAEVRESPKEMIGAEALGERGEDAAEGFRTALLEGGGEVSDKVGVVDGGFSRGVVRERAELGGDAIDGGGGEGEG